MSRFFYVHHFAVYSSPLTVYIFPMNKIYLDLPEYTRHALAENMPDFEIVSKLAAAPPPPTPAKKYRIGALIDKALQDFSASFEVAGVAFNSANQTATNSDKKIKLTEKEIALISYLHIRAELASRQDILQNVWQYAHNVDTRTVESHVHRLNQKFEDEFGFKLVSHKDGAYKIS